MTSATFTFQTFFLFLQRCSPPALVLSLSPGLGPDGLPSPGGYFPHAAGSGSGGLPGAVGNVSGGSLTLGSCLTPPLMMSAAHAAHSSSHRSSPCNEFLAVAMRSNGGVAGEEIFLGKDVKLEIKLVALNDDRHSGPVWPDIRIKK